MNKILEIIVSLQTYFNMLTILQNIKSIIFKVYMAANVTAGEGAESDDDTTHASSFMKNTMVASTMVSGEASETDEEDEGDFTQKGDPYTSPMEAEEALDGDDHVTLTTEMEEAKDANALSIDAKKAGRTKRHRLVYKYDT